MRKRLMGAAVGLTIGLIIVAWWWTRPGVDWACEEDSPVRCSTVSVFGDELSAEEWSVARHPRSLEVSFDRRRLATVLAATDEDGVSRRAVAVRDLTASVETVLLIDELPSGAPIFDASGLVWSADGSMLAADLWDGTNRILLLIDPVAGTSEIAATRSPDDGDCGAGFAFSLDGSVLGCGSGLYVDVANGGPAEVGEETVFPGYDGNEVANSDSGVGAQATRDGLLLDSDPVVDVAGSISLLAFDEPTGRLVVAHDFSNGSWRDGARRSRPAGRISWVDVETRSVIATVDLGADPWILTAPLDGGWIAVSDREGRVQFLHPEADDS